MLNTSRQYGINKFAINYIHCYLFFVYVILDTSSDVTYTSLLRGINSVSGIHWVTKESLPSGWSVETTYKIFSVNANVANTNMLYECTQGYWNTNFLSLDRDCEGQIYVRSLGFIYNTQQTNTAALYRCYTGTDHFVSASAICEQSFVTTEARLGYYLLS